jgi:hypothetical protein
MDAYVPFFNAASVLIYQMALGLGGYVFFFSSNKLLESRGSRFRIGIKWIIAAYIIAIFYTGAKFYYSTPGVDARIILVFFLFVLSFLVGVGAGFSIDRRLKKRRGL